MKEFPLNKDRKTLVDDDTHDWMVNLGRKWHVNADGYVTRFEKRKSQLLHRILLNPTVGFEVDHIDRNKLNNQRCNLRLCTKTQNQGNRLGSRKTGFKGTRWRDIAGKWEAYITEQGKVKYLGLFKTETEAAKAYDDEAIKYFGEFARLNMRSWHGLTPEIKSEIEAVLA